MAVTPHLTPHISEDVLSDYRDAARGFRLSLEAQNRAKSTVTIYMDAVERLGVFLAEHGMPTTLLGIRREHVEAFIADLLTKAAPGTALNRYKSLQAFFKWAAGDGEEIPANPMARMHQPSVPDNPPPVLEQDDLRRILATCEGRDFAARRDKALLFVLIDCGPRRAEAAGLKVADVDLNTRSLTVTGKGSRVRQLTMGGRTAQAMERYLRLARPTHPRKDSPALWLGERGGMTVWGIRDIVARRAEEAGVGHVHPHLFRHTWAHEWLAGGGNEGDLMVNAGWRTREMIQHYGRSAAAQRARDAQRKNSLGDRL